MKRENRDTIQRALGVIEGIWFAVPQDAKDALTLAVEMIDGALQQEFDGDDGK